jgi:hypothetical protein
MWNSRAPFFNFVLAHRDKNRTYATVTLAIYRLRYEINSLPSDTSGRKFFRAKEAGLLAGKAWTAYKRSFGKAAGASAPHPNVEQVSEDLQASLYAIREHTLVSYSSMFETYVQCWSLNYLLAKLEAGGWDPPESELACRLSPIHGFTHTPGVPRVLQNLPFLAVMLEALPHVNIDASTDHEVTAPVSPLLNALVVIKFWRDYRNLIVHGSGLVSKPFLRKHRPFFDEFRKSYGYMKPLTVGQPLRFYDDVVRAMMTTHYKAARIMKDFLEAFSHGHRGHTFAPGPVVKDPAVAMPPSAPSLLLPGDHPESFGWASDTVARAAIIASARP